MKTVLITGIGRGIGKALAERFLAENYRVVGTILTSSSPLSHPNLNVFLLDLSQPESIDHCCGEIARADITIDILINNAGALFDEDETHVIIDKLRKTLEVNLIGTIDFTEHIIPVMNRGGHILNTSSSAGSITNTQPGGSSHFEYHYPAYKISKSSINMYTRTLAMRMKHEGNDIIVSSFNPGWVKTDMGGEDAEITPQEAANDIFELATSNPETGQFWYKGQKFPW